jgi:pantothenate kinase type III
MILPGLTTQFESLHDKTDALPLVSVEKFKELSLPSKSTEECINAGVLYGTAGAVASCVNRLLSNNDNDDEIATCVNQLLRDDTIITATGGDWETIKPFITYDVTTISDLTLIGAAIYPAPD